MKTLSLPYATNKALKNPERHHESAQYTDAESVLVLFTSDGTDNKFQAIRQLQESFQVDKKRVSFLYLLLREEDRPGSALDDTMVALETKNIGLFGDIKDGRAGELLESEFDFLINADLKPNIYTDLLIAKSKSRCKIGRYAETRDKFYDFMIQIDEESDLEFFLNQVYHYTTQF